MEQKRKHTRLDYEVDVQLEIEEQKVPGRTVNISQGGALINTEHPFPFGAKVIMHIELPGVREVCQMASIVRWQKEGEAIGLQFESLRPIEVWAINKLKRS